MGDCLFCYIYKKVREKFCNLVGLSYLCTEIYT